MKPFLAILGREIAERKLLFLGAAFASLFPIVMPWLPGLSGQTPEDLRGGMALGLALITSSLLALVLGATVIARDVGERRIGFYFARPVPGWAIWAGKMLSAALLSLGAGALILLFALLVGAKIDPTGYWGSVSSLGGSMSAPGIFSCAVLGTLLLVVLGHAVSIMVRSRSPWLGVDLVAFAVVLATFWTRNRWLEKEGAFTVLAWGQLCLATLAVSALTLAGLVQVVGGRTDLRRGHRLLSLTLWTLIGTATLGHAAYVHWALRVTPGDLMNIRGVQPAPAGSWIAITGRARDRGGYSPSFLLDIGSGRSIKLPGGLPYWWAPPIFSLDGSRAFWVESRQLLTVDLRSPKPVLRPTGVNYSGDFGIEPSPDGRRIVAFERGRLTVEDLDTGRMLASVPMERRPFVLFLESDRIRILRSTREDEPGIPKVMRLSTLDLDVRSNRLLPISRIELPGDDWYWVVSPNGRRAILRHLDAHDALVADLDTGRISPISLPSAQGSLSFLTDGRIVLRREESRQSLSLLTPDGAEQLRVQLPGARVRIGSMAAPDLLFVATAERGSVQESRSWTSWLLDLRTGRLRKVGSRMIPAVDDAETGSPASRLLLQEPGGLAFFDPETGRSRTILQSKSVEPGLWFARTRATRLPQR